MNTRAFTLLMLFFTLTIFSQSAQTDVASKKAIGTNFSSQAVKAYQESAVLKIEDYYTFLEIYTNSTTSDSLRVQLKTTIYNLFTSKNVWVVDITSKEKRSIKLDNLLQKIVNKNYTFKLSDIENSIVAQDFWTTKYNLEVTQNKQSKTLELFSKIYFQPIEKRFGTKIKEVWTLLLGEIE